MHKAVEISQLGPLLAYLAAVLALVGALLLIPRFLSSSRPGRYTGEPYESGIVPVGDAHARLAIQYYPVAIYFVIFDVESAYIYAWALAFRESGWTGYLEMLVFVLVLLAALAYLWKTGALDWRTRRQRTQDALFKR